MADDWLLDPDSLWHTSGLGREEFVQKLLSTLVFGHGDHRWNVPGRPSERGLRYLVLLAAQNFSGLNLDQVEFVDELELPRRHDDERAGWSDQAVLLPDALLLIELKTEKRSHRAGQLAHYLDLAVAHHPQRAVYLLYLTPTMDVPAPVPLPGGTSYAHTSWTSVAPLIAEVWGASPEEWEAVMADRLAWWLAEVEAQRRVPERLRSPVPAAPETPMDEALDQVLHLAGQVQSTGQQAAADVWPGSPDLLDELRLQAREQLRAGMSTEGISIANVLPWLWSAASSGGRALTDAGRTHGYELRLSRYEKPLWPRAGQEGG